MTNHSECFRGAHSLSQRVRPSKRWSGKITDSMCGSSHDSATEHHGKKLWTVTARWLACYRALGQLPKLVLVFGRDRRQGGEAFVQFAFNPWP